LVEVVVHQCGYVPLPGRIRIKGRPKVDFVDPLVKPGRSDGRKE
jgi:hypothetical protein